MKTTRLLEASARTIDAWQKRYDDPSENGLKNMGSGWRDEESKSDVIHNILNNELGIKNTVVDRIVGFGENFLDSWINAMKWSELGYEGNELIELFKEFDDPTENYLKSANNFEKIYDVYSDDNLETNFFSNDIYRKLIKSDRMYDSYDLKSFREIFSDFIDLKDKGFDNDILNNIFIDEIDGDVRQLADIKGRINSLEGVNSGNLRSNSIKSNEDIKKAIEDNIDRYLQNEDNVKYILDKIEKINKG